MTPNPKLALRAFMRNLNQTIKTKTGQANAWLSKRVYAETVGFCKEHPQLMGDLSVAIDKLPNPCDPAHLLVLVRCRRDELLETDKAHLARGRQHQEPALVDA